MRDTGRERRRQLSGKIAAGEERRDVDRMRKRTQSYGMGTKRNGVDARAHEGEREREREMCDASTMIDEDAQRRHATHSGIQRRVRRRGGYLPVSVHSTIPRSACRTFPARRAGTPGVRRRRARRGAPHSRQVSHTAHFTPVGCPLSHPRPVTCRDARIWRAHSPSIRDFDRHAHGAAARGEDRAEVGREPNGIGFRTACLPLLAPRGHDAALGPSLRFVFVTASFCFCFATRNDGADVSRHARLSRPDRNEARLLGFKHRGVNTTTTKRAALARGTRRPRRPIPTRAAPPRGKSAGQSGAADPLNDGVRKAI